MEHLLLIDGDGGSRILQLKKDDMKPYITIDCSFKTGSLFVESSKHRTECKTYKCEKRGDGWAVYKEEA